MFDSVNILTINSENELPNELRTILSTEIIASRITKLITNCTIDSNTTTLNGNTDTANSTNSTAADQDPETKIEYTYVVQGKQNFIFYFFSSINHLTVLFFSYFFPSFFHFFLSDQVLQIAEIEIMIQPSISVEASWHSNNLVTCRVPPQQESTRDMFATVRVFNRHYRPLEGSNQKRLLLKQTPKVIGLSRQRIHVSGGMPIYIYGTGFVNTTDTNYDFSKSAGHFAGPLPEEGYGVRHLLGCSFGTVRVKATFISRTKIICIVPARVLPSVVDVDVTVNGVDYTTSNVKMEYYATCSPGSYCPDDELPIRGGSVNYIQETTGLAIGAVRDLTLLVCEPGHYCSSEREYLQQMCPRGTFQDLYHQTSCQPCFIGYECPYDGMTTPLLCRAGYVCKVIGLALSTVPCPPGHYCPAGTKTDITCIDSTRRSTEYSLGFNIRYPAGDCSSGVKLTTIEELKFSGYKYDQVGESVS